MFDLRSPCYNHDVGCMGATPGQKISQFANADEDIFRDDPKGRASWPGHSLNGPIAQS